MENSMEVPWKPRVVIWSSYLTPGHRPWQTIIQKDTCTLRFTATLFTIVKTWKQAKCSSAGAWIKKVWCMYTIEYHSAIKQNEVMPFAATRMQLEVIVLSEVRQRKTNSTGCHSYVESTIWPKWTDLWNRLADTENRLGVASGEGGQVTAGLGVWD